MVSMICNPSLGFSELKSGFTIAVTVHKSAHFILLDLCSDFRGSNARASIVACDIAPQDPSEELCCAGSPTGVAIVTCEGIITRCAFWRRVTAATRRSPFQFKGLYHTPADAYEFIDVARQSVRRRHPGPSPWGVLLQPDERELDALIGIALQAERQGAQKASSTEYPVPERLQNVRQRTDRPAAPGDTGLRR